MTFPLKRKATELDQALFRISIILCYLRFLQHQRLGWSLQCELVTMSTPGGGFGTVRFCQSSWLSALYSVYTLYTEFQHEQDSQIRTEWRYDCLNAYPQCDNRAQSSQVQCARMTIRTWKVEWEVGEVLLDDPRPVWCNYLDISSLVIKLWVCGMNSDKMKWPKATPKLYCIYTQRLRLRAIW